ncbi:MICOS complex subunit Mic19p [[Candida] jaroonii]|uniref:MICOS complex subunit Mic19p n=1 Tax=[Candida] jaroonii TaxID=467808 RepID=A0ACA9Y136_9ASCO|nr:MICOS complex subunit Mic19p [[Candida] jaroonii]
MGSTTSKPEQKVFTPSAPIDFSASFLSQLENSKESDYSRSQYTEKYIQDRVQQELTKLERETILKFQDTVNDSILPEDSKDLISVEKSNDKITSLKKLMQENIELTKVEVSKEITSSRDLVLKCLKDNEGRSLNCWEEVQKFKQLVKDL